jgi:hypothetical protein
MFRGLGQIFGGGVGIISGVFEEGGGTALIIGGGGSTPVSGPVGVGVAAVGVAVDIDATRRIAQGLADIVSGITLLAKKGEGTKLPDSRLQAPPRQRGNAPIGDDGHPVEVHHRDQSPEGPLDEMTRTDHRLGDNFSKNHDNTGQTPSLIDRRAFAQERQSYWEKEWDSGRFDFLKEAEESGRGE